MLSVFLLKALDKVVENWLNVVRSGFEICYTVIRHLKMGEISNYAETELLRTSSRPDGEETFPLL